MFATSPGRPVPPFTLGKGGTCPRPAPGKQGELPASRNAGKTDPCCPGTCRPHWCAVCLVAAGLADSRTRIAIERIALPAEKSGPEGPGQGPAASCHDSSCQDTPCGCGPLRLMAVHAHPDDESSKGAATMARYVAEGAEVLVVTLTGGERGDILNKAMDRAEIRDNLAQVRRQEMAKAREILGVQQRFLGFTDSGLPEGDPPPPLPALPPPYAAELSNVPAVPPVQTAPPAEPVAALL